MWVCLAVLPPVVSAIVNFEAEGENGPGAPDECCGRGRLWRCFDRFRRRWGGDAGTRSMSLVNLRTPAFALGSLVLAGGMLWPLRALLREAVALNGSPPEPVPSGLTMARRVSAAIPGTLRALTGDSLWLKAYAAWAVRDRARTESLVRWVTMVDDRPLYFWVNGARIIAYDVAEWRLSSMDAARVPSGVRRRIVEEQALAALNHLGKALNCHPGNAAIWVEMGNIHLYRRGDLLRAAECYRRAAVSPDAPRYAARIYAELLRRAGRDREAYVWLRRLHPTLTRDDPAAMSGVVLRRIRELEGKLRVPETERYAPMNGDASESGAFAGCR